ncbi:MAG: hypothetical protein HY721_22385 [Planctomycetes bacterium]|nr:hypothetical protein [Planctomycetota bacterium]
MVSRVRKLLRDVHAANSHPPDRAAQARLEWAKVRGTAREDVRETCSRVAFLQAVFPGMQVEAGPDLVKARDFFLDGGRAGPGRHRPGTLGEGDWL